MGWGGVGWGGEVLLCSALCAVGCSALCAALLCAAFCAALRFALLCALCFAFCALRSVFCTLCSARLSALRYA